LKNSKLAEPPDERAHTGSVLINAACSRRIAFVAARVVECAYGPSSRRRERPPPSILDAARCAHLSLLTIEPALKRSGAATAVLKWALQAAARGYGATHAEAHVVSVKVRGWDGGVGAPARARCGRHHPTSKPSPSSPQPWLLAYYQRQGFAVVGSDPWPPFLDHQLVLPTFFPRVRKALVEEGKEEWVPYDPCAAGSQAAPRASEAVCGRYHNRSGQAQPRGYVQAVDGQ
jgi:hypothetical protein